MTFADDAIVYRDLDGVWGSFRLVVGGKDVTYFRGTPATIGGYQLTEPYSYGPADFGLPMLFPFEVDAWGTGELAWMGNGKLVQLLQVDDGGVKVRTVWRGFITVAEVTTSGVLIHCDGEASGKLALRDRMPFLFSVKTHVGRKIYDAFTSTRLPLSPFLGGDQGVLMDGRGMSGGMLDYVDALLAATITTTGDQLTIWRRETQGDYHLGAKDTDTIDFSVFLGAHGVDIDLSDDLSEKPNTIYGQGVAPNGLVWSNGKYPGLIQGAAPDYPMSGGSSFSEGTTNADTITGDGITVMISKLGGMGYLDRRDKPGGYDSDVTDAIKDLQDDAGLTQSGHMNTATWAALFDLDVTGASIRNARIAPLAQSPAVKKYLYTANGSIAGKNPDFDPSVPQVDLFVDHGVSAEMSRARKWSRGVLHRAQSGKNWAGTVALTADVFAGDYLHADGDPTLLSRLDIVAGMNFKLRYFDGGTQFHVSVVNVASDLSVTLGVDTQARDAAALSDVIARRIESRSHPARAWRQARRTDANTRFVEFSEVGGQVFNTVNCPGNQWTVFEVVAGQAGSVARVRLETSDAQAAYALAITALKTDAAFWDSKVGNPLEGAALDDVSLSRGGTGYTSAPTVVFTGGGGSGASATATVSGDQVASVSLDDGGTGYQAPPDVSFTGGGGSGAKATASVSPENKWQRTRLVNLIDRDRALLGAWGAPEQPCGYMPGTYTGRNGQLTGDDITGLFYDDGGFDYHTFGAPVLYVAIYPDRDTKIRPQRILWETLEVIT